MSYLNVQVNVSVSDTTNVNTAKSLIKQDFLTSPSVSVQASRVWEDIIPASTRQTIVDTLRAATYDGTTQFQVIMPRALETTVWRLKYTGVGTNPVFRTLRNIAIDATSKIQVTILSSEVARISTAAGTAITTTLVQVGDTLLFERTTDAFTSPFAASNQGTAVVVGGKGAGYIDVLHNGVFTAESTVIGSVFAEALRVYSSGPVLVGDIVELGSSFNIGNRKSASITLVRDDYVEFAADAMVAETLIGVTSLKFYDRYVNSLNLKVSSRCTLWVDSEAFPVGVIDASGGYLYASVEANKIEIENIDTTSLSASLVYSTIAGTGC